MSQISRFLERGTATFGSLSRGGKSVVLLCFCCITACFVQLVMPVVKSLVALSLVTGTADKLWSSIYCSPCGNSRGKDFGSNAIATLCWCDRPEIAVELLAAMLKKGNTQSNWPMVSGHLRQIDQAGRINGARWLELCRPFDEYESRFVEDRHYVPNSAELRRSRYFSKPARVSTFNLIKGYENHGLLSECEAWYKKVIAKEEELKGHESFAVREIMQKLANFYERHNRRADADKLIAKLHVMETHPGVNGDCWRIVRLVGDRYKFVRLGSD